MLNYCQHCYTALNMAITKNTVSSQKVNLTKRTNYERITSGIRLNESLMDHGRHPTRNNDQTCTSSSGAQGTELAIVAT